MPGPYFKGQEPSACGCFYPDVTRVSTRRTQKKLFCKIHGFYIVKITNPTVGKLPADEEIPTEQWREEERRRLQKVHE